MPVLDTLYMLLIQLSWLAYPALVLLLGLSGLGIPVPEDLIILATGILAQRDILEPAPAWLACYVGVVGADICLLALARRMGFALLKRKWIKRMLHPRGLRWARHQVHDHGVWAVVAARFIPGSRMPVLIIAGASHMGFWKYALADAIAAIFSVSIYFTLGWMVSTHMHWFAEYKLEATIAVAAIGVLIAGGYGMFVYLRRRRLTDGMTPRLLGRRR